MYFIDLSCSSESGVMNNLRQPPNFHSPRALASIWFLFPTRRSSVCCLLAVLCARSQTDKKLLYSCRDSIVQGFAWGTREGPLCDEPIRQCKFRLLSANLAPDSLLRTRGQLIPTARRCLYSAFLLANPRLLEPVYASHFLVPADCISTLSTALSRRRGHILSSSPLPASPLYSVVAQLPLIDSFGFEVDVRVATQGQAAVQSVFSHWDTVPGDPLDERAGPGKGVNALERVEGEGLARDFMIKTRRRKGLVEQVDARKYLDAATLDELLRMTATA